jgi:NitT/TauT family transport system permease protein
MVPLLMLWMGFGISVKIIAVALSAFPINMMSTMTGVRNVTPDRYELMKSLCASKLQMFFQVLIPSALPNVFTGMRLGTIFATTSAVGAELISGNTGVGPQISYNTEYIVMDMAFSYVYVMVAVGVLFYCLVNLIEFFVVRWKKLTRGHFVSQRQSFVRKIPQTNIITVRDIAGLVFLFPKTGSEIQRAVRPAVWNNPVSKPKHS